MGNPRKSTISRRVPWIIGLLYGDTQIGLNVNMKLYVS